MKWAFKKLERGDPERDPHEAEFFHLTNLSEVLVREIVQNSLDARISNDDIVKVIFTLGEVREEEISDFLKGLEPHLNAAKFNYDKRDKIQFVAIEDFNTTGLDGDTGETNRPTSRSNFYNFWWCEGRSLKTGKERGRWGLGKTTLHIASELRSFWGLTVRADDKRQLLMGKALLKTHRLVNDAYSYYGYFVADEKEYRPINDSSIINNFKKRFLLRRDNEPGFSIVIPMPQKEIDFSSIVRSVIIHYAFAILKGVLCVEIADNIKGQHLELNSANLIKVAQEQDWRDTTWEERNVSKLIDFINSVATFNPSKVIALPDTDYKEYAKEIIGENLFNDIKKAYEASKLLGFKIPIKIRPKGKEESQTYFWIFIKKDPDLKKPEEIYIRSGILIPDVRSSKLGSKPIWGMLVADDQIITEFLGDAETPAHTNWNEKTEGFKDKYEGAAKILRFIKNSISNIVNLFDTPSETIQYDLLQDIFYIDENPLEKVGIPAETKDGPEKTTPPDIDNISSKPQLFEIHQISGGFKVTLNKKTLEEIEKTLEEKNIFPIKAIIRASYEVRRGNPFRNYTSLDFNFGAKNGPIRLKARPIRLKARGCKIEKAEKNEILVTIKTRKFELSAEGFDKNRDLVVKVDA
ncbi:MAG: hypothetical protein NZ601_05745 [candidate division WOR-3 bacterium]|nr:hypothetical protein [candidate division WOR-3 bacterium]